LSDNELLDSDEALHSVNSFSQSSVGYSLGITEGITLSVALPYIRRDGFREASHDHEDDHHNETGEAEHHEEQSEPEGEVFSSDISGWGDVSLLGRFALNRDEPSRHYYALLAGLKTPTGNTNEKLSDGEKAEVDHQPGSGSWDPLLGIAYSTQISAQWSVSSNLLYHLTTEGARDTTVGDRLMYNAAVLWSPASHSHSHHSIDQDTDNNHHPKDSWQYVLELNGEWHDRTGVSGSKDDNTGGDVIFASAGLRWSFGNLGTHISLGTPLYRNLNGIQSEPDWQLSTGVSMAF
jgi:Putative MetA-pathway of phenol degradation